MGYRRSRRYKSRHGQVEELVLSPGVALSMTMIPHSLSNFFNVGGILANR